MLLNEIKTLSDVLDVDFESNQAQLDWLEAYRTALKARQEIVDTKLNDLHRTKTVEYGHNATPGYTPVQVPARYVDVRDLLKGNPPYTTNVVRVRDDKAKDPVFVRRLQQLYQTLQDARVKEHFINQQLKVTKKAVAREKLAGIRGQIKPGLQTAQPVDPSQHPSRIPGATTGRRGKRRYLTNPIHEIGAKDLYAGPPLSYPDLSTPMKLMFVQLDEVLKELGHEGFRVLYGARIRGVVSFIAIAAGGRVVWYKRGSPATNVLYLGGFAYSANRFVMRTKEEQKKEIKNDIGVATPPGTAP